MIEVIFLVLSTLLNCVLGWVVFRTIRKLLQLDELFFLISDDVQTNILHLDNLLKTPTFSGEPEVVEANRKMKIMLMRMEELSLLVEDHTGRKKKIQRPQHNPPVVA